MRKKIGIITILRCNNYGAELQAFALQKKLNLMGYDAEIIDYLFYKNRKYRRERISYPFYHFPFKKRIKESLLPFIERVKTLRNNSLYKERNNKFEQFHSKHTKTSKMYYSFSELYNSPPVYDVYCVGSDQVWNPNCYTSLYPYFLTFAPKNAHKMSYASSFGVSSIPNDAISHYSECLCALDNIGVREETGKRLVKEISGKPSQVVADPTLLLCKDEWLKVANNSLVPNDDYILLYVLKDAPYITKLALQLAEQRNLKIVRICKGAFLQDNTKIRIINIMNAAPDDFVGLFAKAQLILTNSFHGTVFANIFKKDFYSIIPKGKDNNSRIIDLLNKIGNQERIVYEGDCFKDKQDIDWITVEKEISTFVKSSEEYIYDAIG